MVKTVCYERIKDQFFEPKSSNLLLFHSLRYIDINCPERELFRLITVYLCAYKHRWISSKLFSTGFSRAYIIRIRYVCDIWERSNIYWLLRMWSSEHVLIYSGGKAVTVGNSNPCYPLFITSYFYSNIYFYAFQEAFIHWKCDVRYFSRIGIYLKSPDFPSSFIKVVIAYIKNPVKWRCSCPWQN